jgi:hypothetical protein
MTKEEADRIVREWGGEKELPGKGRAQAVLEPGPQRLARRGALVR